MTKIYNEEAPKDLLLKFYEDDDGVDIHSVSSEGQLIKSLARISQDGIFFYNCADNAGIAVDEHDRVKVLYPGEEDNP